MLARTSTIKEMSGFAHTSFEHNIVLAKCNSRQYNIKNEI